jgi:hypothetical protein
VLTWFALAEEGSSCVSHGAAAIIMLGCPGRFNGGSVRARLAGPEFVEHGVPRRQAENGHRRSSRAAAWRVGEVGVGQVGGHGAPGGAGVGLVRSE